MIDPRALALGLVDPASFMPPPDRRSVRGGGPGRALIRAIRRELAPATEEPAIGWLPRLQRYPY